MASVGCLFVCTFGNFLALVLIAAYIANNSDLGNEQGFDPLVAQHDQNEGYESN